MLREKLYPMLMGFAIVGLSVWLVATQNKYVRHIVTLMDNVMYDERLNLVISPHQKSDDPIAIVDIDERSLIEQGRWPWPKVKFAELLNKLDQKNAAVIVFTIVFSEPSQRTASDYLQKLKQQKNASPELIKTLNEIIYLHEGDEILANEIKNKPVVLGFMFNQYPQDSKGVLPPPILSNVDISHLLVSNFKGYISNLSMLQEAKDAGFVTGIVDDDGIIRKTPLLLSYQDGIYAALALQAVRFFLHIPKIEIEFSSLGNMQAIHKINLGKRTIYTDAHGSISIPYQGYSQFFPYYSATDILNDRIPFENLAGKIIFIGTSIPGLSDLRPTPLQSLVPSVEIQATIAATILNNFIPYTPIWARGAEIGLIFFIGGLLAIIFPFLRAIALSIVFVILISICIYLYAWLWATKGLIFSFSVPIFCLLLLFTINLIYGFLIESRRRDKLFKTFSQYVPREYAKKITEHPNLPEAGEMRGITILVSDIRHFTDIAEKLNAREVKNLLNQFFTPLADIIIKQKGTIDKYLGDMLIAFWGAPSLDLDQKQHALEAALQIQEKAKELRHRFIETKLPPIKIGIGINTGEVYLGDIGSDIHRSYTVIGDPVNVASRIETLTKFYMAKTIISQNTLRGNEINFAFRPLDKIRVKGKQDPILIYQLVCRMEEAKPSLFVELNRYEEALDAYYNQKWSLAFKSFTKLVHVYPEIKVYSIFLKRIEKFMHSPPAKDWDGVFIRMRK